MAILKYIPEDFIVQEIPGFEESETGIQIYNLKKRNYTTERAVSQIAQSLHIPRKFIGYAGTKDKPAITYQYISIKGKSKDKIINLNLKDISLEFAGFSKSEMKLGDLNGNEFEITLRDLPNDFQINLPSEFLVPNYFDEQRFSNANLDIGVNLLKQDFKTAIEIIKNTDGDFKEKIELYLEKHKNDFVGALKILPKKTTLFYIHSVQSYFFNEILANKIKENNNFYEINYSQGKLIFADNYEPIDDLPLIGYMLDEYDEILSTKNITHQNFIIRSLPNYSLEGSYREAFFKVENFQANNLQDDEEFVGRKKCVLKFNLKSGAYATIVLKAILAKQKIELKEERKKLN
ncbi:MAG: tRNA pseudouridine(13) synthase TruD [Candidatus Woesearchaeota archaeon]